MPSPHMGDRSSRQDQPSLVACCSWVPDMASSRTHPAMCCLPSAWNNRTDSRGTGSTSAEQNVSDIEVPVLVVGGSLVSLSAAVLLAQHGVRSLAVEHHRGTAIHPRAAHATQRTMEIFRSVGLEEAIREKSAEQFVQNGAVVAVDTLVGGATRQFIADLNSGI